MLFDINRQYHSPRHPRRYPSIVQQLADGKLDSAAIFQRDLSYLGVCMCMCMCIVFFRSRNRRV